MSLVGKPKQSLILYGKNVEDNLIWTKKCFRMDIDF